MKEIFLFVLVVGIVKGADTEDSSSEEESIICRTLYCVGDSDLLFGTASNNFSVDPCKDFKEYSLGGFIRDYETDERYFSVGMQSAMQRQHETRLHKLLASDTDENEPRVFKVMKNFLRKCSSSSELTRNSRPIQGQTKFKRV